MLQMGYSLEEIEDSFVNKKYNQVMATYLLLGYKSSDVSTNLSLTNPGNTHHINTSVM